MALEGTLVHRKFWWPLLKTCVSSDQLRPRANGGPLEGECPGALPSSLHLSKATILQMAPACGTASAYRAAWLTIGFLPGLPVI